MDKKYQFHILTIFHGDPPAGTLYNRSLLSHAQSSPVTTIMLVQANHCAISSLCCST